MLLTQEKVPEFGFVDRCRVEVTMTVETDFLIGSLGFHWRSQDVHGCPPP